MIKEILKHITALTIVFCSLVGAYTFGYSAQKEPESNLIWIDDIRVNKDSTIYCSAIYNESNDKIGEYIQVSYQDSIIYIECLDNDNYSYQEFKESWLMAFRGE